VRILEEEVAESEFKLIGKIFDNMSLISAKNLTNEEQGRSERLVAKGLLERREITEEGIHYLLPSRVIGAYFSIKEQRATQAS